MSITRFPLVQRLGRAAIVQKFANLSQFSIEVKVVVPELVILGFAHGEDIVVHFQFLKVNHILNNARMHRDKHVRVREEAEDILHLSVNVVLPLQS